MSPRQSSVPGRGFPVDEAARLLRDGVHLPDYPDALVAEAWRQNFEAARADALADVRRTLQGGDHPAYKYAAQFLDRELKR